MEKLLASLDCNENVERNVFLFEELLWGFLQVFVKKKVFDYGEETKDMIELNSGREWRESEILKCVAIVKCNP